MAIAAGLVQSRFVMSGPHTQLCCTERNTPLAALWPGIWFQKKNKRRLDRNPKLNAVIPVMATSRGQESLNSAYPQSTIEYASPRDGSGALLAVLGRRATYF